MLIQIIEKDMNRVVTLALVRALRAIKEGRIPEIEETILDSQHDDYRLVAQVSVEANIPGWTVAPCVSVSVLPQPLANTDRSRLTYQDFPGASDPEHDFLPRLSHEDYATLQDWVEDQARQQIPAYLRTGKPLTHICVPVVRVREARLSDNDRFYLNRGNQHA